MRRVVRLAAASGDLVGLSSNDEENRIVRAIAEFAARGQGLFSIGEVGADGLAGRLYIGGIAYCVLLRVSDEVVFVEAIVAR